MENKWDNYLLAQEFHTGVPIQLTGALEQDLHFYFQNKTSYRLVMDSKTEELKEIVHKYFEELDDKSLDQVLKICHYESYGHKQILQRPGKKDKTLFIILKGSARAYVINDKGQELNCHMRSEGFLFGDPKAFSDQAQELFIEAIGEVEILKFNVLELEDLGTKNPGNHELLPENAKGSSYYIIS